MPRKSLAVLLFGITLQIDLLINIIPKWFDHSHFLRFVLELDELSSDDMQVCLLKNTYPGPLGPQIAQSLKLDSY